MDDEIRRRARTAARSHAGRPGAAGAVASSAFDALRAELDRERAGALGRAGQKLADAIAAVRAATDPTEYESLHESARRARWELEVVREAVGLRHHGVLDELYPMPPRSRSSPPQAGAFLRGR
jgi:hypothetical protein